MKRELSLAAGACLILAFGCEGQRIPPVQTQVAEETRESDVDALTPVSADAGVSVSVVTDASAPEPEESETEDAATGVVADAGAVDAGRVDAPPEVELETDAGLVPPDSGLTGGLTVAAGLRHTCALSEGQVECWGSNEFGQLQAPNQLFRELAAGRNHTCAITLTDEIECWGDPRYQLTLTPPAGSFTSVTAGDYHSCALRKSDSRAVCWGSELNERSDLLGLGPVTQVAAGGTTTCALLPDRSIQCRGTDAYGKLQVPKASFVKVAAGRQHNCGLLLDGTVRCWGNGLLGRTDAPEGVFNFVAAGDLTSCGLRRGGAIECWAGPTQQVPEGAFRAVTLGRDHGCAIPEDRDTIVCWGENSQGQTNVPARFR